MRKLMIAIVMCLAFTSVHAESLRVVEVSAPAINCVFDPACRVVVDDSTDSIALPASGSNFLQTRTFRGQPGSEGEGLYVYEYRVDLRRAEGILNVPCLTSVTINFGSVVNTLDFNSDGKTGDQVFVVTRGGLGSVGLASAEKTGNTITFNLSVCAGGRPKSGESTFFFGLVSRNAPQRTTATLVDNSGDEYRVQVRAPKRTASRIDSAIVGSNSNGPLLNSNFVVNGLGLAAFAHSPAPKGACPPANFDANAPNLLTNPGFETVGKRGRTASFSGRDGANDTRSAAANWTMHTSNDLATVTTELVKTNRVGGDAAMLHVIAGSNEGGVYQLFDRDDHGPMRVVASIWVYVRRGRVVLATGNEGRTPTYALSTTTGRWEQLHACSDGKETNNWFVIYSTDVDGSEFFVDSARVSAVRAPGNQCGGMLIDNVVPNVTFPGGTIAINGSGFGNQQGTKIPAINRGNVVQLQVIRWTDTQILAKAPLDVVGGTYRVLIYCDNSYRTSSNSLEVTVRDDIHRPR